MPGPGNTAFCENTLIMSHVAIGPEKIAFFFNGTKCRLVISRDKGEGGLGSDC